MATKRVVTSCRFARSCARGIRACGRCSSGGRPWTASCRSSRPGDPGKFSAGRVQRSEQPARVLHGHARGPGCHRSMAISKGSGCTQPALFPTAHRPALSRVEGEGRGRLSKTAQTHGKVRVTITTWKASGEHAQGRGVAPARRLNVPAGDPHRWHPRSTARAAADRDCRAAVRIVGRAVDGRRRSNPRRRPR